MPAENLKLAAGCVVGLLAVVVSRSRVAAGDPKPEKKVGVRGSALPAWPLLVPPDLLCCPLGVLPGVLR
jgi:hypothetical protein